MGNIQVLDDHTINQIAAGEVIERPASVVKELVENSLDAKAKNIWIRVEEGGTELIVVRDDGLGMDRDDATLAFRKHSTSKIREFEDLQDVVTSGFRGEALPSIASVSRLRITTSEKNSPVGTRITIEGNNNLNIEETPAEKDLEKENENNNTQDDNQHKEDQKKEGENEDNQDMSIESGIPDVEHFASDSDEDGQEIEVEDNTNNSDNKKKNENNFGDLNYKAYTSEFDEVIKAEDLETEEELGRLRQSLDQQLLQLKNFINKLANKLQRKLLAKQNRSWNFDLEEGLLDTSKL